MCKPSKLRLKRAPDTRILRANPEQVQCIGASEQYRLFVGMSVYTFEPSESTSVSEAALKNFKIVDDEAELGADGGARSRSRMETRGGRQMAEGQG